MRSESSSHWIHNRFLLVLMVFSAGIETKENILNLIDRLPESTRGDVLKKLREVLEEEDALSELEDMVRLWFKLVSGSEDFCSLVRRCSDLRSAASPRNPHHSFCIDF